MTIRLTDDEREALLMHCIGSGEYPCEGGHAHRHLPGCALFGGCGKQAGDIEPGLVSAVEQIVAARLQPIREALLQGGQSSHIRARAAIAALGDA